MVIFGCFIVFYSHRASVQIVQESLLSSCEVRANLTDASCRFRSGYCKFHVLLV